MAAWISLVVKSSSAISLQFVLHRWYTVHVVRVDSLRVDSLEVAQILSESTPEMGVTFRSFLQKTPIPSQPLERWHSGVSHLSEIARSVMSGLPSKAHGCPLLLGSTQVKEYMIALRSSVGVVNTSILLAAAEGIAPDTNHSSLKQHGGSLVLKKLKENEICEA